MTTVPRSQTSPQRVESRGERGKRAAIVARQIEDDIAAAGWPVGTVLGTEAELTERYRTSRAVVQEAVRLVEHHKIGTMRRGPKGGLMVRAPDLHGAATALVIYLEHVGTSVADLMDVRLLLEPLAVGLATERLTEEGIVMLRDSVREKSATVPAGRAARPLPTGVHRVIAEVCGNPVLHLFLEILRDLSEYFAARPRGIGRRESVEIGTQVRTEHRELVETIIGGQSARAQHLATEHLREMRASLLTIAQNRRAWSGGDYSVDSGSNRFAEKLAQRIRADLARDGAVAGDVVGSETDLRERYQISRQVLREAVRLLEHHGVAKMQRGPGGGLVVTTPDPWASIEAIAVYLDYQKMDIADLRAVRSAIELACIDRVVARRAEPEVVARLRTAVDFDDTAGRDDLKLLVHAVHRELASLSGNPVLELFSHVLSSLWERHRVHRPEDVTLADREILHVVKSTHQRIVEAILAGDPGLARHRMIRHQDALVPWWE